ncbi:MAG: hypothetical protein ACI9QL_000193 [Candidatus Omnitrophota bacterium]|jgi:hypothetical protein
MIGGIPLLQTKTFIEMLDCVIGRFIFLILLFGGVFQTFATPADHALAYLENFADEQDLSADERVILQGAVDALSHESFIEREKAAYTIVRFGVSALPRLNRSRLEQPADTGLRMDILGQQIRADATGLPNRLVQSIDLLIQQGDERVAPRLLELLDNDEEAVRHHAIYALRHISGQSLAFGANDSPALRVMATQRWREWWNMTKDDFTLPDPSHDYYLLVSIGARVKLLRKDGHPLWDTSLPAPSGKDQVTPPILGMTPMDDERLAVTTLSENYLKIIQRGWVQLSERDVSIKTEDVANSVSYNPISDQLMLSLAHSEYGIAELHADGSSAWLNGSSRSMIYDAHALPNGNVLFAEFAQGRIREVSRHGVNQWEFAAEKPTRVNVLVNGNILTNIRSTLVEVDRAKEVIWSHELPSVPHDFTRLPDGRTAAFVPQQGLIIIDQDHSQLMLIEAGDEAYGTVNVAPLSYLTFPTPD